MTGSADKVLPASTTGQQRRFIAGLLATLLLLEPVPAQNLVVNPGFDSTEPVGGGRPSTTGDWNGDLAEIVSPENGINPHGGFRMLKFGSTGFFGPDPGFVGSEMLQLFDVTDWRDGIDAGLVTIDASFMANRIAGDAETDTQFTVRLEAYDGAIADFPSGPAYLARSDSDLFSDGDTSTWEQVSGQLTLPAGTTYVALNIMSVEDVFDDATGTEFDGHYADSVALTLSDASINPVIQNEVAKLLAVDGAIGDQLGGAVAFDGDTAVISATEDDDVGLQVGSVIVFVRDASGNWTEQAVLLVGDADSGDAYGTSVALDGDTALVGAPAHSYADRSGQVIVFVRDASGNWTEQARLSPSDGAANDQFGAAVSLSGDTALIGARDADVAGVGNAGAAYVFVRSGTTWSEQQKLVNPETAGASDLFGDGVALDGETAVVGAPYDDNGFTNSGSGFVFVRNGSTWSFQAKLTADDGMANDRLGRGVALDGDTAVLTAPHDDYRGSDTGSAYVFARTGTTWNQQARLNGSDVQAGSQLGVGLNAGDGAVDISGDIIVVGTRASDNGGRSGSAYAFQRNAGTWSELAKLVATDNGQADYFGAGVGIDGTIAVIGSPQTETLPPNRGGAAYVFEFGSASGVPDIEVSPPSVVDFGDVEIGTSGEQIVTASNVGDADLTISALTLDPAGDPDFSISVSPALPAVIPSGDSVDVELTFAPSDEGAHGGGIAADGALSVQSDDPDESTVNLSLFGAGIAPQIDVPDVVGLTQAQAEAEILTASLAVGVVTVAPNDTVPAGHVISQNPVTCTACVPAGIAVDLVISSGPALVAVPNIVGETELVAAQILLGANLELGTRTYEASATVPAGRIISQDPAAGVEVAEGTIVDAVVSTGPPLIDVPDVAGQSQATAQAGLVAAGLAVGNVTTASSETVPEGDVISQDPAACTACALDGDAVDLVVSTGPEPVFVTVPDIVGLEEISAAFELLGAGLMLGNLTSDYSETVPSGHVISQDPAAGTVVQEGSAVDAVLSRGPRIVNVPNVIGLTRQEAEFALIEAGLTVGTVTTAPSNAVPPESVVDQDPAACFDCADAGEPVNLVIAIPVPLIDLPDVTGLSRAAAEATIAAANLTIGTVTTATSETVPAGDVISQDPVSCVGCVEPGQAVDIVVSLGPPIDVPDVTGLSQAAAEATIETADLTIGTVTMVTSNAVPPGDVISQNPAACTACAIAGDPVDIVVSVAPADIPDLTGLNQTAAELALSNSGLVAGNVSFVVDADTPGGIVLSQDPAACMACTETGTVVDIVVSLGFSLNELELVSVTSTFTGAGSTRSGTITTDASYTFDAPANTVTMTGQETIVFGNAFTHNWSGTVFDLGAVSVTADTWSCTEGDWPTIGISVCGQYLFGENGTDESELDYSSIPGIFTLGGDDQPLGLPQQLADYAAELVSFDGSTLVMATPGYEPAAFFGLQWVFSVSAVLTQDVPNVVGQSQADAEAAIIAAGLTVGSVTTVTSDTVPLGDVISQDPTACIGCAAPGQAVGLVVSIGPPIDVPDVTGLSQATAETLITAAGLNLGEITNENSTTAPARSVIRQDPAACNGCAAVGQAVDLVVSVGPTDAVLVTVPNVVGEHELDGAQILLSAGLTPGARTYEPSETVPAGHAISQDPAAGTEVPEGTIVDAVVSSGPQLLDIPAVTGQAQATAEANLIAAGLTVGNVTSQSSETVPAGDVVSQDPAACTGCATAGDAVNLVVSSGPPEPVLVTVPNIVGEQELDAAQILLGADLTPGTRAYVTSESVPAGEVISQDPGAGAEVPEGTVVDAVVSSGPPPIDIPDVTGQTQAMAQATLVAAGLTVGNVTSQNSETVPEGGVISQNPAACSLCTQPGSQVHLTVSSGPITECHVNAAQCDDGSPATADIWCPLIQECFHPGQGQWDDAIGCLDDYVCEDGDPLTIDQCETSITSPCGIFFDPTDPSCAPVSYGSCVVVECVSDAHCDDGNSQTIDQCDLSTNTCLNTQDTDGDGIPDSTDNAPLNFNPDQGDVDGDGVADVLDPCPGDPVDFCDEAGSGAASIGPEGGTLISGDGNVKITVPPGALDAHTSLSFTDMGDNFLLTTSEGDSIALFGVEILPEGTTFNEPVELVMRWPDADNDGTVDGTRVPPEPPSDLPDCSGFPNDRDGDCIPDEYDPCPDDWVNWCIASGVRESTLLVSKDNEIITDRCDLSPGLTLPEGLPWRCDRTLNTFAFEVGSLSEFILGAALDTDGDGIPDAFAGTVDICPVEDATGFDVDNNGCIDSFAGLVELIVTLVEEGVISEKIQNSLLKKISNAERSFDKHKICTAVNQLEALKRKVAKKRGRKISDEAAGLVTNYADSVIDYMESQLGECGEGEGDEADSDSDSDSDD